MHATIKPHKGKTFRVNVYGTSNPNPKERSSYENIITEDPNTIAQVLLDLIIMGFPIEKAIKIVYERIKRRDWMGI